MHARLIRASLVLSLSLALAACSTYRATVDAFKPEPAAQPVPKVDLTNAKWQKLSADQPDANPVRAAIVAREDKIGATRVVLKAPQNFTLPPYWLTNDGTYTVLKGTFVFDTVDADGRRGKLVQGPGAFARVPANLIQNVATQADGEALLYITVYGDWSPKFAEGAWGQKPALRRGT
jgi:hypothetical protein